MTSLLENCFFSENNRPQYAKTHLNHSTQTELAKTKNG